MARYTRGSRPFDRMGGHVKSGYAMHFLFFFLFRCFFLLGEGFATGIVSRVAFDLEAFFLYVIALGLQALNIGNEVLLMPI